MSRHPLDRQSGASPSRPERYAEIERHHGPEGSNPATKTVHQRPKDRTTGARLKEFARVERGEES